MVDVYGAIEKRGYQRGINEMTKEIVDQLNESVDRIKKTFNCSTEKALDVMGITPKNRALYYQTIGDQAP